MKACIPSLTTSVFLVAFCLSAAEAANIGVTPKRLTVDDKLPSAGKSRVGYLAVDKLAGITKGAGTTLGNISAVVYLRYGNGAASGSFTLPEGAFGGTTGWVTNRESGAKYSNKAAPGGATQAKSAIVKRGKHVKLSGAGSGDVPFNVFAAGAPLGSVYAAFCVMNDGQSNCQCSELNACTYTLTGGGTGAKLRCKGGLADASCVALPGSPLDRPADPVVLTGADVSRLAGIAPDDLVAFRWLGWWQQVPVQVDERKVVDFDAVYNGDHHCGYPGTCFTRLDYADAGTLAGADTDATLDADDEVVFMAADTGEQAAGVTEPAHTIAGSGVELQVIDPLGSGPGYVYLFEQDGSLDAGAGKQYVSYEFDLLFGDYPTDYMFAGGGNPENTTVTTDVYSRHFSDRWITDELRIVAGGATGVDILDRNMVRVFDCFRTEQSFSDGEGAFVVNRAGPVRALRSYVGANSGPFTQRQHLFYRSVEDTTTFSRVHALPSTAVLDFIDYSPDASGMVSYDNNNPVVGATIDGMPDTVSLGFPQWQLVTGVQGSLTHVPQIQSDIANLVASTTWEDDSTPDPQCTGDDFVYGASGLKLEDTSGTIPNTDPTLGAAKFLEGRRVTYYDGPGLGTADAQLRRSWVMNPLAALAAPWP